MLSKRFNCNFDYYIKTEIIHKIAMQKYVNSKLKELYFKQKLISN